VFTLSNFRAPLVVPANLPSTRAPTESPFVPSSFRHHFTHGHATDFFPRIADQRFWYYCTELFMAAANPLESVSSSRLPLTRITRFRPRKSNGVKDLIDFFGVLTGT
jgi:hypothetical protein